MAIPVRRAAPSAPRARCKPWYEGEGVKLYCADSRGMPEVGSESVDLVVTSPPYWDIKDYRTSGQMGLGQSYGEYWVELGKVLAECRRVLRPGRSLGIVVGTRISDGDLRHIPADLIQMMPSLGFTLRKEIIWVKPKGTQGLWQRGTTQFLRQKPFPGCFNINIQHEFILIFSRDGALEVDRTRRLDETFIKQVAWSVWELPVSKVKGHPAPFPETIPRRLIDLYTAPGELVLDPFMGSGTTALAAVATGRVCVGYDISEEYCQLARKLLEARTKELPLRG